MDEMMKNDRKIIIEYSLYSDEDEIGENNRWAIEQLRTAGMDLNEDKYKIALSFQGGLTGSNAYRVGMFFDGIKAAVPEVTFGGAVSP